ncbi:hypothetical protein SAMN05444157_1648 [Frankineae bacterium MT45]|nr:hypothetical protein SAMN05444157_1648 [Frankineae bacterium MT45]
MKANSAWDVDFVVSYDEPFWPHPIGSLRDNARVGPLRNESGLWLTGTSYHRSQVIFPSPAKLKPELPDLNETATQILTGGPGFGGVNDMYWFIESITARENVAAAASN